jgi:hypothetical protein
MAAGGRKGRREGVLAAPSISFIIRYYMRSQAEQQLEASASEDSLSQDSSSQQDLNPHLSNDQQA